MKKILILFITWFILLSVVNKVSLKFLKDNTSYELPNNIQLTHRFWIVPWLNFDGRNYLEIVLNGYESKSQINDLKAFFPLYPLLIKTFKSCNPIIVGIAISLVSFLFSLFIFDKIMNQDKISKDRRWKALLLIILFPTSYYFFAFYTESLFLLFTLLFFYYVNKRKFLFASIFISLASVTRIVGLTLIPVILWEAYKEYRNTKKIPWSISVSFVGFVFYSVYMKLTTGNALSMVGKHKEWGRQINIFGIFIALKDGLLKLIFKSQLSQSNMLIYSIEVIEFVCALFLLILLIVSFRKLKFSYWLYIFFSSMFMFSSSVLISIPRLILPMFPIFIFISKTAPKRVYYLICLIFSILLVYLSSLFLRGYWVA